MQALEVLKYLSGVGTVLAGRLVVWDGERGAMQEVRVERNPRCIDCADTGRAVLRSAQDSCEVHSRSQWG